MPKASGTKASANNTTECASAAAISPTIPNASPRRKVVLSPSRLTIGRMNPPWMTAPSSPNAAKK